MGNSLSNTAHDTAELVVSVGIAVLMDAGVSSQLVIYATWNPSLKHDVFYTQFASVTTSDNQPYTKGFDENFDTRAALEDYIERMICLWGLVLYSEGYAYVNNYEGAPMLPLVVTASQDSAPSITTDAIIILSKNAIQMRVNALHCEILCDFDGAHDYLDTANYFESLLPTHFKPFHNGEILKALRDIAPDYPFSLDTN